MVEGIDWAMVSSWAALVTAAGAVVSLWIQNRHARFTRSLDIFLRLEAKYDTDRMKELRRKAAAGLLEGKLVDEAYYVMDFFEEAGLLLRMKAIQREILFENFYHSILAYWFTAKKLIVELRNESKELYDHFEFLAEQDLVYAKKKTGENPSKLEDASHWRYFMEREGHAY